MKLATLVLLPLTCIRDTKAALDISREPLKEEKHEHNIDFGNPLLHPDVGEDERPLHVRREECQCRPGVEVMDCSNMGWTAIPEYESWLVECADTLTSLNLANNKLARMPFRIVEKAIKKDVHGNVIHRVHLPKLKYLDLSFNLLNSEIDDSEKIYHELREKGKRSHLDMNNNDMDINLAHNYLTSLDYIGGLSLRDFGNLFPIYGLQLTGNSIFELPDLDELEYIKWMDLKRNPILLEVPHPKSLPTYLTHYCVYGNMPRSTLAQRKNLAIEMEAYNMNGKSLLGDIVNLYIQISGVLITNGPREAMECRKLDGGDELDHNSVTGYAVDYVFSMWRKNRPNNLRRHGAHMLAKHPWVNGPV